jgi:hypothetical protein
MTCPLDTTPTAPGARNRRPADLFVRTAREGGVWGMESTPTCGQTADQRKNDMRTIAKCLIPALGLVVIGGCGGVDDGPGGESEPETRAEAMTSSAIEHVFVIIMENHSASSIYGSAHAPYIDSLLPKYGHATDFADELPHLMSEPHYVWMEAGTNAFADHTFSTDGDATAANSTSSKAHLVTQIKNASNGASWMSYQEGLDPATTGACPIDTAGHYHAKHNPFVFFQDVSGNPPSKQNAYCAAHHRSTSDLAGDLANDDVATYNVITPNDCHDMHKNSCPGSGDTVKQGDDWLAANLPPLIAYANAHAGVVFITWDEPSGGGGTMPFIVVGPHVKANHASSVKYSHSSLVKSVEKIAGVPVLAKVASANDLADFFDAGFFP